MKNPIKTYSFWLKIAAAALLLAFGIWLLVDNDSAIFIVLMFTGIVAVIFSIIRVVPLMRSLKTGKARLVCLCEIVIHLGIAAMLILGAISKLNDKDSNFSTFMNNSYRFFIAGLFVTRVISYSICSILFKEETDKTKFWVHMGLIIISCVLCALSDLKSDIIAIIIGVIALICSVGLIIDGAVGYSRYRKAIVVERKKKEAEQEEVKDEETIEAPTDQEFIIPEVDEAPDDSAIVN